MSIQIKNLVLSKNRGDGFRVEGDVNLDAENIHTFENDGHGMNIIRHAGLLERLGLPKETDPVALVNLLTALQNVPVAERHEAILKSGILQKIGKVAVDCSTFISNVLSIAGNPVVHTVIQQLTRGA